MLTDCVKATRRMYAALQHLAAPDREPLSLWATACDGTPLYRVTVQIKIGHGRTYSARRKYAISYFRGLVHSMYPEAHTIGATFDRYRGL